MKIDKKIPLETFKIEKKSPGKKENNEEIKDKTDLNLRKGDPFLEDLKTLRSQSQTKTEGLSEATLNRTPQSAMSLLKSFNEQLGIKPSLLKEKYELMKTEPHMFFRATPALYFHDLKHTCKEKSQLLGRPGPTIMINGDTHLRNFGTVKGPDHTALWGMNDFDQAEKGSCEWDLERLATSAVLTARQAGLSKEEQMQLVEDIGEKYFKHIKKIARGDAQPHSACLSSDESHGKITEMIEKAEEKSQKNFLEKFATCKDDNYNFLQNEELKPVSAEKANNIKKAIADYTKNIGPTERMARPVKVLDISEKLKSGGSSYGLERYYILVAHSDPHKEPLILEMKELPPIGMDDNNKLIDTDGEKVSSYQKSVQKEYNQLLGYTEMEEKNYLIRELEREKANTPIEKFTSYEDLSSLGQHAAKVIAFAHGRTVSQAKEIENWVNDDKDEAIANLKEFASSYADKVEEDYKEFKKTF